MKVCSAENEIETVTMFNCVFAVEGKKDCVLGYDFFTCGYEKSEIVSKGRGNQTSFSHFIGFHIFISFVTFFQFRDVLKKFLGAVEKN